MRVIEGEEVYKVKGRTGEQIREREKEREREREREQGDTFPLPSFKHHTRDVGRQEMTLQNTVLKGEIDIFRVAKRRRWRPSRVGDQE